MSQKHLVSVFTKLESFRGAGEKVRVLLTSVLNEGGSHDDFLVEHYAATKQYKDDFASRTAVIVIDARQTRALITPERRDKNVDHWDELRTVTDSFTFPGGAVLIVVYGDERSRQLEDDDLISKQWLATWKYNDAIAYDLAVKKRCFTVWDKFNKAQTDRLRNFFKVTIPLYKFYKRQLKQSFIQNKLLQVAFQKAENMVYRFWRIPTILLIATGDIPEHFIHSLHLNPFVITSKNETGNTSKNTVLTYEVVNFLKLNLSKSEIIMKVYVIHLPAESVQHQDKAHEFKVDELQKSVDDIANSRFNEQMPRVMRSAIPFIPTIVLHLIWKLLRHLGMGPLTYDALARVTHINMVDANEDDTKVITAKIGVSFNGKAIPVVQDAESSSEKVLKFLAEVGDTTTEMDKNGKAISKRGVSVKDMGLWFIQAIVALILLLLTKLLQAVTNCKSFFQRTTDSNLPVSQSQSSRQADGEHKTSVPSAGDSTLRGKIIRIVKEIFAILKHIIKLLELLFSTVAYILKYVIRLLHRLEKYFKKLSEKETFEK